ncbi:ferredoxin [Ideonella sp. DXS29W]|uniref:Ferredoxin n=1 Tax=Ideonella lacteola TaxID=2984193 RepID=A0ABU9C113_9BURK
MLQHSVKSVWVDQDVCLGHYICVVEAPLVFEEREGQWTVQILASADSEVLGRSTEALFVAAAVFPVRAIKLTLDTGEVVDGDSEIIKEYLKLGHKK